MTTLKEPTKRVTAKGITFLTSSIILILTYEDVTSLLRSLLLSIASNTA